MLLTLGVTGTLAATLAAYGVHVTRGRMIYGPETWFLATGVCTFAATLHAASSSDMIADEYVLFMGTGLTLFVAGAILCNTLFDFRHRLELRQFVERDWIDDLRGTPFRVVLAIGIASLMVTFAYFYALGFLVPFAAIRRLWEAGPAAMIETYNALRRTTRTGTYLGLGYVLQFKNCLLPLTTLLLLIRARSRPRPASILLFLVFFVATSIGVAGTGNRYGIAAFGGTLLLLGAANYMHPFRLSRAGLAVAASVLLVVLSVLTLMMGRRGQSAEIENPILWAPYNVVSRVCIEPARERFEVYRRYLCDADTEWGAATFRQLALVLPGRPDRTLSNTLHERLYGSAEGNVTLDVWGSLWLDFRWVGLLVAGAYGFLQHLFYIRLIRGKKSLIRLASLTYAGFILGLATDPQVLLLRGFLTVFLFLGIVRLAHAVVIDTTPVPER